MDWNLSASEAYQELLHQNELDTLNVFYVACTRAAERLYILSNKNDKPSGTVADLLFDFAGNQLSANKNEFQIGTAEPAKTQVKFPHRLRPALSIPHLFRTKP